MTWIVVYLKGLIIGVAMSAPLGPVAALGIQRALTINRKAAVITGMGAVVADTFYGTVAVFGISFISNFFLQHQISLRILGGIFLIVLGIREYYSDIHPTELENNTSTKNHLQSFTTSLAITMTNPATILGFVAIFALVDVIRPDSGTLISLLLIFGIFSGGVIWWFFLSTMTIRFKNRIEEKLHEVSQVLGIIIAVLGGISLLSVFIK